MEFKGIDVSSYQGKPDWKKVKAAGIQYAVLRITEKNGMDASFEYNYEGCQKNRILTGVYKYSYAMSLSAIQEEARQAVDVLAGRKLDLPVWLDLEYSRQRSLSGDMMRSMIEAFRQIVEKAGYRFGIYCNVDWYDHVIPKDICSRYDFWLAAYPYDDRGVPAERLRPAAGVGWQYSSKGKVPGISGHVDMDLFYKDYKNVKEEGDMGTLQKFIDLGNYYADNGGDRPYLEKKSNAYLDDFTKNAGYNNYTKFARDVNAWGQPGCQGQPWCAEYQFWKLTQVLGITLALQIMGGGFYNCVSITNHAKSKGTWHGTPKKGALVIFRKGAHVGSVNDFDGTYIYTNEGNTSSAAGVEANGGSVRNKRYRRTDTAIDGYVWIDWGAGETAEEWKAAGTATASADHLYVREAPNGYVLGELMKGNRFEVDGKTSGAWTHVKVAGIGIGWVAAKYVKMDGRQEPETVIRNKQDKTQRLFVGKVTASSLSVRTWAGTEYPLIKKWPQLGRDNLVDVMNFTQKDTGGASWYYVRIAGKYFGFVSAKYVEKQ